MADDPTLPDVPTDHPLLQPSPAALNALGNDATARVLQVQGMLAGMGYLDASRGLDGRFGPNTQAAVASFQRDSGLTPDGIVGSRTVQAMDTEFNRRLGLGPDQADAVRATQGRLAGLGFLNGRGVDGISGPVTQVSIYNFQNATVIVNGAPLIQDGILGPQTASALQNPLANGLGPNPNLRIEPGLQRAQTPGTNGQGLTRDTQSGQRPQAPNQGTPTPSGQTRPGSGGETGEATGTLTSPLPGRELRVRNDRSGNGAFGASRPANRDHQHHGVDWLADTGTAVSAAASGRVTRVGHDGSRGYGNWVEVDHGNGVATRYAHLSNISVRQGDTVRQGQTLGASGDTGNAHGTTPHLHFEVLRNGRNVNPTDMIGKAYGRAPTNRQSPATIYEQQRQGGNGNGQSPNGQATAPRQNPNGAGNAANDPGQTSNVAFGSVFRTGENSKPLNQLTAAESHDLARTVFGDSYGARALIALDQANGNSGALIQREIALGRHEGGLQFGRHNSDSGGGSDTGTFQIHGRTPQQSLQTYQRNVDAGISLYERQTGETVDRSRLTVADKDVFSHSGHLQGVGNSARTLRALGDPNLSDTQVASLMSNDVQRGVAAIGQGVVSHLHAPVDMNTLRARTQEPDDTRARPIIGAGDRQEITPELRQNAAQRSTRAANYQEERSRANTQTATRSQNRPALQLAR